MPVGPPNDCAEPGPNRPNHPRRIARRRGRSQSGTRDVAEDVIKNLVNKNAPVGCDYHSIGLPVFSISFDGASGSVGPSGIFS